MNRSIHATFVAITLALAARAALAQCDDWRAGPELTNTGYVSETIVWDPDGAGPQTSQLVAAGGFGFVGWPRVVAAANIASWDGAAWQPLGTGIPQADARYSPVQAMAVYGGQLVVGGYFPQTGGVAANNIASWDGTQWHTLGTGTAGTTSGSTTPGFVYAMTVLNGELVVAGDFVTAGGVFVNGMARWNGTSWLAFGDALALEQAGSLQVHNNELIAAGFFSQIGGVPAHSIARWTGSTWAPLGQGIEGIGHDSFGIVRALAVYNSELIAVGDFDSAGGMPANRVAAWNGASWRPLAGGLSGAEFPQEGETAAVFDGDLVVGGHFDHAGGSPAVPAFSVARWNGSSWSALGSGLGSPPGFGGLRNEVYTLTPFNGMLVAGGSFYNVGGSPVNGIAQWNGTAWRDLPGVVHELGTVRGMTIFAGDVVAGGAFGMVASSDSRIGYNLARWDGLQLSAGLGVGGGTDGPINALRSFTTGSGPSLVNNLVIAGEFTVAGDDVLGFIDSANRVAMYSEGVTTPPVWAAMGTGFNNTALALERLNGSTYAAGAFTASGNGATALNHIARFDGTNWIPVGPGAVTGVNGIARAMKSFTVSATSVRLVVGGDFTSAGGVAANRIAIFALSTTTGSSSWGSLGAGFNGTVHAVERFGGFTCAAGEFTASGATPLGRIARFDGTNWQPLGAGLNGTVRALLSEGGFLYASGDFTASGSTTLNHLARWDGNAWGAVHGGTDAPINVLAAYHDEVHAGGSFLTVRNGSIASPSWARYLETGVPWIARQPQSAVRPCGTNFAPDIRPAAGYGGLSYQWRKDGVPLIDGPTGTGSRVVGATGNFALINVSTADEGDYDYVLSNGCGSTTSLAATLTVTGCCPADFHHDGVVNSQDFFDFLTAFFAAAPAADINHSGAVNSQDFFDFLTAFFAGC
jgi:hypothetical protein